MQYNRVHGQQRRREVVYQRHHSRGGTRPSSSHQWRLSSAWPGIVECIEVRPPGLPVPEQASQGNGGWGEGHPLASIIDNTSYHVYIGMDGFAVTTLYLCTGRRQFFKIHISTATLVVVSSYINCEQKHSSLKDLLLCTSVPVGVSFLRYIFPQRP